MPLGKRAYPIFIGDDLLARTGSFLKKKIHAKRIGIVTGGKVKKYYLEKCKSSIEKSGFAVSVISIPEGEKHKNLRTISAIYDSMVKANLDRGDAIVALGGGVTGDMAGFASATYMRGIDFIQIPTTLLAQVDSSVGGKTGIDHPGGKNLIGAFYQPKMVICDYSAFSTLPEREFRCGMAEVIKYGIIKSPSLFSFLEKSVDSVRGMKKSEMERIIKESCSIKASIVSRDEREGGIRAFLNFGHTFGHGIETALNFRKLNHGEAVAIGMVMAVKLSSLLGYSPSTLVDRVEKLLRLYGLPTAPPRGLTAVNIWKGMSHDKKVVGGKKRFVLVNGLGKPFLKSDLKYNDVKSVME